MNFPNNSGATTPMIITITVRIAGTTNSSLSTFLKKLFICHFPFDTGLLNQNRRPMDASPIQINVITIGATRLVIKTSM